LVIPESSSDYLILNTAITASIGLSVVGEMKTNQTVLVTAAAG